MPYQFVFFLDKDTKSSKFQSGSIHSYQLWFYLHLENCIPTTYIYPRSLFAKRNPLNQTTAKRKVTHFTSRPTKGGKPPLQIKQSAHGNEPARPEPRKLTLPLFNYQLHYYSYDEKSTPNEQMNEPNEQTNERTNDGPGNWTGPTVKM